MSSDLAIRDARPDDEAQILRFIRALAEYERLTHELMVTMPLLTAALFGPVPRIHALLAELAGEPVGYAAWGFKFSTFHGRSSLFVEDVFVVPPQRGRGIGRAIFRDLARRASTETCGRMEWSVLDWNAPSIRFYQGLGARPVPDWITYAVVGEALATLAACQEGTQNG